LGLGLSERMLLVVVGVWRVSNLERGEADGWKRHDDIDFVDRGTGLGETGIDEGKADDMLVRTLRSGCLCGCW
jgi:hypothetical protein